MASNASPAKGADSDSCATIFRFPIFDLDIHTVLSRGLSVPSQDWARLWTRVAEANLAPSIATENPINL